MKKKHFKQVITAMLFLAAVATFSSCNRGYGCPSNFSINQTTVDVVKTLANIVINR